LKHVVCYIVET